MKAYKFYPMPSGKLSHVYTSKNYQGGIKLLCKRTWHVANNKGAKNTNNWYFGEVKQWSLGAGHNSNCKECIVLYLQYQNRNQRKALINLTLGIF